MTLIERIKAAQGPDRQLDAEIAVTFGNLRMVNEGHPFGCVWYDGQGKAVLLPRYTASIDAAFTLVPEGWAFSLAEMMGLPLERRWRCHLRDFNEPYNPSTCRWLDNDCRTAPLAICVAALRARKPA